MPRLVIATVALLLTLTACSSSSSSAPGGAEDGLLAEHGLAGKTAVQVIDALDRMPVAERPDDLMASVRVDELLVSDDATEVALDIPDDRFYLSVAPYLTGTHDCFYHSLTTCKGELGGRDVDVTITSADGEVLVDRQVSTFDNGFVGFWLPRGVDATLEVSYQGKTGRTPISTGADDPTCLTTLRLT